MIFSDCWFCSLESTMFFVMTGLGILIISRFSKSALNKISV